MKIRSIVCHEINDDIGTVRLEEAEIEPPGAGEVRVRLKACAINFPDLLMIQGKYQFSPPLPFAPGGEAAGDIEACGPGVRDFLEGDPVVVSMRYGGFSEAINVPVSDIKPKPAGMDYSKAASYQTAYLTAYVALHRRGQLQKDETVLVHGATGGVGMAAVEMGKYLGAKVIATGGTDAKLGVVKSRGADAVINYSQPDGSLGGFREEVKSLTDGRGVDVVFDPVGGDVFDESMRCINWGGRILTIGFTSGRWPSAPVNLILIKQISVIGVRAGEFGRQDPIKGKENHAAIYRLAEEGLISPHVSHAFPLEQAVDGMRLLEQRQVIGKAVVTMNGFHPSL
jgi:NADPH2:quinone reductase